MTRCSNSSHYQELSESCKKPYVGQKRMASLLSEAQHRVVQVVFSGAPSGYEKDEAPCPPIPRSRPNCFKDLPEIRDADTTSIRYIPSNSGQSSPDPVSSPEHVVHALSDIGPSMTSIPAHDCQAESSPASRELPSPPPGCTRETTGSGDRSLSPMRSRLVPRVKLDSIAEDDEPLPSPSISSDIGDAWSSLTRSPDIQQV